MLNPNALFQLNKAYRTYLDPISEKENLTRIELDILLFLANSPQYSTASEIVKRRFLTKSHVSTGIRTLVKKELLRKEYRNENRKTVHLVLPPEAADMIHNGQTAQKNFFSSLQKDLTSDDIRRFKEITKKIMCNADQLLEEDKHV